MPLEAFFKPKPLLMFIRLAPGLHSVEVLLQDYPCFKIVSPFDPKIFAPLMFESFLSERMKTIISFSIPFGQSKKEHFNDEKFVLKSYYNVRYYSKVKCTLNFKWKFKSDRVIGVVVSELAYNQESIGSNLRHVLLVTNIVSDSESQFLVYFYFIKTF